MLERDAVVTALSEYAADARRGDGRIVLVGGEAGVGKTAVLEQLFCGLGDASWYWGTCEGSFTPRPLGPVYDVATQVGGDLARACEEDASRQRVFGALLSQLLGSQRLTVLCLEDLHWADEATLDLLGFLATRLRHSRTLLIVTYRNDGLTPDEPLRRTLGGLATNSAVRRVDLPPLSSGAVAELARGHGVDPAELFALTSGNPFLVTEVLAAGGDRMPASVREAVLARAARLGSDARAVLDAAAVIGGWIEVDLLRHTADCDMGAIDGCLRAGAMLSDGSGFRFRHQIARQAVEEALPAHRRVALNRRVLDLLVEAGVEDAARLAHHADAAADATGVLRFAPLAARQATSLGAHREAAKQYQRALRYARDARTRATLLSAVGTEYGLTDRWHDAGEVQEEALALWREVGDELRVGDLLRQMARTMWRLCRGDEAIANAEAAVAVLEQLPPSVERGWAYAVLGVFRNGIGVDNTAILAKAGTVAEQFGDKSLLANVVDSMGCAKDGADGAPDLRRALDLAFAAGDDAEVGRAFANLQCVFADAYRLTEAEQVFHDGMSYCADHDIGTYEHCLIGAHGGVLERLGRWDEADAMLTFDLTERELSPINKISKLVVKGLLDARRGRPSARATLDEALAYAEAGFEPGYMLEAAVARLEAAWLAGDSEGAGREAERALPVAGTHGAWFRGSLGAWLRRCGLPAPGLGPVATPYELLLSGDWRGAVEAWRGLAVPYEEGLALLDSGDADAMVQAVRIFERLGAVATVARAQAVMRQRGFTTVPRARRADTRANRFGLTRREQEVLELVCDGLTNADIGQRLFIAEKTVDNHVSSVLAKMSVNSRRDAARLARQLQTVERTPI